MVHGEAIVKKSRAIKTIFESTGNGFYFGFNSDCQWAA